MLRRSAERAHLRAFGQEGPPSAGRRWAALTARRRWTVLVVSVLGLGVTAVPAADLQLGLGGGKDPDTSAARAQKMIDDSFGPGYSGTLVVLVQGAKGEVTPAAKALAATVKDLPGVASVAPPAPAAAGDAALVGVTPTSGPETERTKQVLAEIRDARGTIEQRTGTDIDVTGTTAVNIDVADKLSAALPVYCLLVLGLALLLLVVVFRSIAVPLFGLAMDYEVFLVSRMREEYAHGASPAEAMVRGFGHGAKVVTAAALIMIAVFGSFVFADMQVIKGMGFALDIGVLLDAFVVRMALVPAVMAIAPCRDNDSARRGGSPGQVIGR
ncbi:MMPL family transporter [Streptomyces sp. LZ34]